MTSLQAMQARYVRSLFSIQSEENAPSCFPAPSDPGYRAEVKGRQALLLREIEKRFPKTLKRLRELYPNAIDGFFRSDFLFDPRLCIPSPEGFGPAYENVSKFFFWLRDQKIDDADILLLAQLEFSTHLLMQVEEAIDPYYARFSEGIFWEKPRANRFYVLDPQFNFHSLEANPGFNPSARKSLLSRGLQDLDQIGPTQTRSFT